MTSYLNDFEHEMKLRLDGRNKPDPHAYALWGKVLSSVTSDKKDELNKAFNFSKSITYKHAGLSSEIYFPHVLRVAALSCMFSNYSDYKVGVIGLLHNALEVTSLTDEDLKNNFSNEISDAIKLLTVDRALQCDAKYKKNYYQQLLNGPEAIRLVKVIDKLDNIFLLHLNPDVVVKRRYRKEIYDYVLPMAKQFSFELYTYLNDLMTYSLKQEGSDYE
jgi:(p)ppGpp synthase/HD superfamily hydrolase